MSTTEKKPLSEQASVNGKRSGNKASGTIAALRFLIDGKTSKSNRTTKDGEQYDQFSQQVIMIGSPQELRFTLKSRDVGEMKESGVYVLSDDCFVVNQYGGLELRRWGLDFAFLREMNDEEIAKFDAMQTSLEDFMG